MKEYSQILPLPPCTPRCRRYDSRMDTSSLIVADYNRLVNYAKRSAQIEACRWYDDAKSFASDLAYIHTLSLEQAASVISAFSPRVTWARNKFLATQFLCGEPVKCLKLSLRNAEKAKIQGFAALNGMKTHNFARAISGDESAVVIDTWMMQACGHPRKSLNKREYNLMAEAVREVAAMRGWKPAHMQALIWIMARGRAQ